MKPIIFAAVMTGIAGMVSVPAQAQQVCMMADEMRAALIDWYGERAVSQPNGEREQIWASSVTGTWTLIKIFSDGSACVLAQGDNWGSGAQQGKAFALLAE